MLLVSLVSDYQIMKEDILSYSLTGMFRGTPCRLIKIFKKTILPKF